LTIGVIASLFVGLAAVGLIAALRYRARTYRRLVPYDRARDFQYAFDPATTVRQPVTIDDEGFRWPAVDSRWDTALLEVRPLSTVGGRVLNPFLRVSFQAVSLEQYLERGVNGLRYANITRILAARPAPGELVRLSGRHLTWARGETAIVLSATPTPTRRRALIVASHPDDAEIAAFGLYSVSDATIVTVTAGDIPSDQYAALIPDPREHYHVRAHLRIWDSIALPMLAGVPQDHSVNLGYFDATLAKMFACPDRPVSAHLGEGDIASFRSLNVSPLVPRDATPTWQSLVRDLTEIIDRVRPEIIATPHPTLDDHPDHIFTTLAVCEALRETGRIEGQFFLYTNHPTRAPMYPLGPPSAVMSVPPQLDAPVLPSGVFSLQLTPRQCHMKFFAIEGVHDLRSLPLLSHRSPKTIARMCAGEVRRRLVGMGADPKSYLRRATRPNELFFVLPFTRVEELRQHALDKARPIAERFGLRNPDRSAPFPSKTDDRWRRQPKRPRRAARSHQA
jgi:LmbE family N-acetylglucosaminyl deacetylase